jgi:serine/threonine protein kinase
MIGKTISHYKILEELGRGGMGVVYKAEDTKLKRTVALKFLPTRLTRDPEAMERFIQEAQAASALDHPNICTIHEIDDTDDGQMFIAMACYTGETLEERISRSPLPLEIAVGIATQVAQGLAKAHAEGIVHRDIKPANVFVADDGQVKILDFGLAKLGGQTRLTKEGTTLGTVAHMSPEQSSGSEVDHRSDIWSLGVVLYEMVAGRMPFAGDHEQAVMYSIVNSEPEPLTALRTGVPMGLERVVAKCLEKNPADRYQHIDDVIVDLNRQTKRLQTP